MMKNVSVGGHALKVLDQGFGPGILLVHGFPLDHQMWFHQIACFAKNRRVIAPDLRGFGASDPVRGTVTMDQFADDLAVMLDVLQVTEPIAFCGLSMGGYVGWQFWKRHRERLGKLILCDTRAAADSAEVARGRELMAQEIESSGDTNAVASSMIPKLLCQQTLDHVPDTVRLIRDLIVGTSPHGIAAAQRGMAQRPDMTAQLSQIAQPTLVLGGQSDVITPSSEMREFSRRIPNAHFSEIKDAGHMAPIENPVATNRAIESFLGT